MLFTLYMQFRIYQNHQWLLCVTTAITNIQILHIFAIKLIPFLHVQKFAPEVFSFMNTDDTHPIDYLLI